MNQRGAKEVLGQMGILRPALLYHVTYITCVYHVKETPLPRQLVQG